MSGQQKLSIWSVTLPKPKRFSIGNRRYDSTSLSASWLTRTWNCFRTELRENISANCRRVGTAPRAVRTSQRVSLPNHKRRRICFGHRAGRDEAGNDVSEWGIDDGHCCTWPADFIQTFEFPGAHPDASVT